MKTRSLIPLFATLLIVALVVANWSLLSETVSLNLLFARFQAAVVVLLLLCIGIALLSSLVSVALISRAWTVERRRLLADLDHARGVAEKEEESRTQAIRTTLDRELILIREKLDRLLAAQSGFAGRERSVETPEASEAPAIEPELIPPRPSLPRRRH